MKSVVLGILCLTLLFIVYVEGFNNPFSAWNITPPAAAIFILLFKGKTDEVQAAPGRYAAYGFALGTVLVDATAHAAWLFDWRSTATGSSTSGLIFVVLPFLAFFAGCMGMLVGWLIGSIYFHRVIRIRD